MQDNVTQSDRDAAGRVFRAIGRDQSARLAELGRGGDGPVTLAFAAHRLASTAQPEVKALVEALEGAATSLASASDDLTAVGEHELAGAYWMKSERASKALAAYHEAQP